MQDNKIEINQYQSASRPSELPRRMSKRSLGILIIVAGLIVVGTVVGLIQVQHVQTLNHVKRVLLTIPDAMNNVAQDGAAYPQALPANIATNSQSVTLSGGGSYDGTAYCVTGTSDKDVSIVLHISSVDKTPKDGACPVVATLPAPGSVTGLRVNSFGSSNIDLSWNATIGAVGYTLQCSTNAIFSTDTIETVSALTQGICSNLKPSTNYYVRIQAKNSSTAGVWSNVVTATTSQWSLAPMNLTLKVVSQNQVDYSWSPVNGAEVYILERATDPSFIKDVVITTQKATFGSSVDLRPGTVYYFHVKAVTAQFDVNHAAFSSIIGTLTTHK